MTSQPSPTRPVDHDADCDQRSSLAGVFRTTASSNAALDDTITNADVDFFRAPSSSVFFFHFLPFSIFYFLFFIFLSPRSSRFTVRYRVDSASFVLRRGSTSDDRIRTTRRRLSAYALTASESAPGTPSFCPCANFFSAWNFCSAVQPVEPGARNVSVVARDVSRKVSVSMTHPISRQIATSAASTPLFSKTPIAQSTNSCRTLEPE